MFEHALGDIAGAWVLDVATGKGGSVGLLSQHLNSYATIVGVDINLSDLGSSKNAHGKTQMCFSQMNAERLAFGDGAFDCVNIGASLHHLANVSHVLKEMRRVLKSGGRFIIEEMHQDGQDEAQLTAASLHHWIADVDAASGLDHFHTLPRQMFLDFVTELGLMNVQTYDWSERTTDPFDTTLIAHFERVIDQNIGRAHGLPEFDRLARRGEKLRRRLSTVGVNREPILVIVAQKP